MFTSSDAATYTLPDSFDKLDALGDVYFPQLGALLLKANELIYTIYGIQPFNRYKVSQTPINTKGRREGVKFIAKKNEANQVVAGLRAKDAPTHLLKQDGSPSNMHFALLGFSIADDGESPKLLVGFEPYILKYHQQCRDEFADAITALKLETNLGLGTYAFGRKASSLSELMRHPKALVISGYVPGVDISMAELAILVISYVGMFPLLDVFTLLSNGTAPNIDYTARFHDWVLTKSQAYIEHFSVEPIKEEGGHVSEALVRGQFETLLSHKFPTLHPTWLKAPGKKSNLELDGYCENLRLAFEYQGEYHYIYVPIHHQGRSLEEVQKIDELKLKLCQKQGVSLIQVPYWEKGNLKFILDALKAFQRPDINALLTHMYQ